MSTPVRVGATIVIALAALASLPVPVAVGVVVLGGGIAGLSLTRHGTRGRLVVQLLLGLVALALGLGALGAIGMGIAVAVQIGRGHDNGFGGLAILVALPVGIGLAFGAAWTASLALGGSRRRHTGADGVTWREPPAFP